ncbi:MAG: CoA transferase, partial [Thaumarchaeota archaeon]|nr:CoA transferase [Nitrososphaerota archaeon]
RKEPSLAFGSDSYYNLYGTADKKLMAVAAIESEFWRNLTVKLGLDDFASLKRGSRDERMSLKSRMAEVFSTKTRDEWSKMLMMSDTCATPVLAIEEALDSDWAKSSGVVRKNSSGKRVLGTPIRFSPHQKTIEMPAPALGEHTRPILSRIGYSKKRVDSMIREGVVSVA